MNKRRKFLSIKKQIINFIGFLVLLIGLLFHFISDTYPMFRTGEYLYIIVACLGGGIVIVSVFLVFFSNRTILQETWHHLIIESALTFACGFSLIATILHIAYQYNVKAVDLGLIFMTIGWFFFFTALFHSANYSLFKQYYVLLTPTIILLTIATLLSGVFLTFTGSVEQITSQGIGVLFAGIFFLVTLIIIFSLYPKWKVLLIEGEDEQLNNTNENEE